MKDMKQGLILCVLVLVCTCLFQTTASARDFTTPMVAEEAMFVGDRMFSANGAYRLDFGFDGNLVLFRNSDNVTLWHSNTSGVSAKSLRFGRLGIYYSAGCHSRDPLPSNLYLLSTSDFSPSNRVFWCGRGYIGTPYPYEPTHLILQDDGKLILWQQRKGIICHLGGPKTGQPRDCSINYVR